jgi:predicted dehydrogenase
MKIGIIGAENSHSGAIAKIINIEKKINGITVDYIWGETDILARKTAEAGRIPNIVTNPKDMLEKIDAVIVDHRHAKYHLKAAISFVTRGIPAFIDKPFCYRFEEGLNFLTIAKKYKTPVTSFSILPHQKSFRRFLSNLKQAGDIVVATLYGPADIKSKYGGVFFYGIHQVDIALKAFGYDVKQVLVTNADKIAVAQLFYPSGLNVFLNLIKTGNTQFSITAVGTNKTVHQLLTFDDNTYLSGVKEFTKMFKTGKEPQTHEQMLKPIQVLEAMQKSLKTGKSEKITLTNKK